MYPILEKQTLSPTLSRYLINAPFVARKAKAGNFVIVRVEETGERIPLTIVESDKAAGTITLIVQAIGKTTKLLATKNAGDSLADVAGPLGNPTELEQNKTIACIGGGVGTAELLPIARALKKERNVIHAIIGARSSDLIILKNEMAEVSEQVIITTDDGSAGRKGLVTDALKDLLDSPSGVDAVYAIGPLPMMKAVSVLTRSYKVKTYVSLNAVMVDGTGMCGGCRVTIGGQMKFACVDGPEFDGHTVDFDELIMRNRSFTDLERLADERFAHRCAGKEIAA